MSRSLLLAPTAPAAADWLADHLEDGEAVPGDLAQGFHSFAIEQAGPALVPSRLVLSIAAHAAAARVGLPLAPSDGAALASVFSELHASSAGPADVAAAGRGNSMAGHASLLSRAFAAQTEWLKSCGRIDPGAVATVASRRLVARRALRFDELTVRPRTAWTQGELVLCASLARAGLRTIVELPYDARRPELFLSLQPVHQELHRDGAVEERGVDPAVDAAPPLRARLLRMFEPPGAGAVPAVEDSSVAVFTAPTAEAEVREIAVRVRALVRAGASPDSIAVAGAPERCQAVVRALLAARLPAVCSCPRNLAETLPGRAALALLQLADGGISREPLCELLLAGLLPLGGRPGSRSRGRKLAHALREAGSLDHGSGTLLPPIVAHLRRLPSRTRAEEMSALLPELERVVAGLAAMPASGSAATQTATLWAALHELGITSALLAGGSTTLADGEGRARGQIAAACSAGALDRLRELLSEIAALEPHPGLKRGELRALLASGLAREPAPGGRTVVAGVTVCEPAGLIGRSFDHVFLLGLIDAELERPADALLPAGLRESLCAG
ncbi:MAG TPA: hypothetical protein VMB50_23270, partial [Myxococcales bacterium]|nr:hypothetical protein [Myxococcales bacterium]